VDHVDATKTHAINSSATRQHNFDIVPPSRDIFDSIELGD
jgi:hypothetical protein